MTMAFRKTLAPGIVGHITIVAPLTTKVLCQRFSDISGGGDALAMLPLDSDFGVYGTHTCQLQNTLTLHLLQTEPIEVGSHILRLGVLNPNVRAAKDYWAVELLPGTGDPSAVVNGSTLAIPSGGSNATSWRTAEPMLQIQVSGFGVSTAFTGP